MIEAADSIARTDSLRRAVEQLFLKGAHFGPAEAADTLQAIAPSTAADLFGAGSILATPSATASAILPLTSNPLFQILLIVLAVAFVLLLHLHGDDITALFSRSSSGSGRTGEIRSGSSHSYFLNLTGMIGLLLSGILFVKYTDELLPAGTLPYQAAAGLSLIVTAILLLIVSLQAGILSAIGVVTLSRNFITELQFLRRTSFAIITIITGPALLFFALASDKATPIWSYIIIAEVIFISIFFMQKTLMLFISKKISILHWFLYLCTVEIFPVSLAWLILTRQ